MSLEPAAAAAADARAFNRLVLTAQVIERGVLRYTPAGLPVTDLVLQHASVALEDGLPRKVSVEIKALAIGEMSRSTSGLALGSTCDFAGFLAQARNGRGLLFHITSLAVHPLPDPQVN